MPADLTAGKHRAGGEVATGRRAGDAGPLVRCGVPVGHPVARLELGVAAGWFAVAAVGFNRMVRRGRRDGTIEFSG